jgi:Tol biopolymer transport system component/predicted Ser/Thr protein kinase
MIAKTILHYKIIEKLGEGGMGVVYLAEDSKLKRKVAIKFLPRQIATISEERERFEIEAQAAAALNHPNIATIYAIEKSDDETFIVMEYIEGKELKDIVGAHGNVPLPVPDVISYATQIAKGLQAAHEKGIIHRDIKSSNVMITKSGEVKIMDFGLAKVQGGSLVTKAGTTLGTVAYMSPEQARSEEVDAGTDIWAFGVLLYEMLSGKLPFQAAHQAALIYEIVNTPPPSLSDLNNNVDADLTAIVMKCLEKNKVQRYQMMAEVAEHLKQYQKKTDSVTSDYSTKTIGSAKGVQQPLQKKPFFLIGVFALLIIIAFLISYIIFRSPVQAPVEDKIITRITSSPGLEDEPAWSPDGKCLAYTSNDKGNLDIMVMPLAGGRPIRVVDSDADDAQPAWSPDGSRLAFVSARDRGGHLSIALGIGTLQDFVTGKYGDIFLIPALGGTPVKLVEDGYYPSWSPDGKNIVYQSPRNGEWNLWKVPAEGGVPTQLTNDEEFDFHPCWSPDGKWIVYGSGGNGIYNLRVVSASGGAPHLLTNDKQVIVRPVWSKDGSSIIYSSNKNGSYNLWKIPFSLNDNGKSGTPRQVTVGQGADVDVSISHTGEKLAFSTVLVFQNIWELTIANGETRQVTSETSNQDLPRCSPDGKTLLIISTRGGNYGLWVVDLNGAILQQLSAQDVYESFGSWSPDGKQIAYRSIGNNTNSIYIRTLGSLSPKEIAEDSVAVEYPIWSPDDKFISYYKGESRKSDIWIYDLESGQNKQLTNMELSSSFATWSPDGKYITFQTMRGSVRNLWIIPLQGGTPRQITFGTEELSHPQWSPVDQDLILFVLNHKNICTVSVSTGEIRQLTHNVESDLILDYPSWSPDGKKAYYSISRKTGDIYSLENY